MCRELALVVVLAGCATSLDASEDPPGLPAAPALPSCAALAGGEVVRVSGRVRPLGASRFLVDGVHLEGGRDLEPALITAPPPGCVGTPTAVSPAPALDASALGAGLSFSVLATFEAAGRLHAYVQGFTGLEPVGVALATWDEERERLVADPGWLFTGDRPAYGDAALVEGGHVFSYGCRSSGFLEAECFMARVAVDRVADRTAYRFYRGGAEELGTDPDDAWPLFRGGGGLAVVRRGERVIAAYVTPLGDRVIARSGLSPTGPWSRPHELAACQLVEGAFCGSLSVLADPDPAVLALTYGVASFDPVPSDARATRLVRPAIDGLP